MAVVYVPPTMLGRAALACWNNIGKGLTPLQEAVRVLRALNTFDVLQPAVWQAMRAAETTGDGVYTPYGAMFEAALEAIIAQEAEEQRALDEFERVRA